MNKLHSKVKSDKDKGYELEFDELISAESEATQIRRSGQKVRVTSRRNTKQGYGYIYTVHVY